MLTHSKNPRSKEQDSEIVVVLGGSGFIGRAIVRKLLSTGSCIVTATSRTARVANNYQSEALRWTTCDVLNPNSVIAAIGGADCVINCYRDDIGEGESARAIANVLNACQLNGVKKLIYFSSIAVYGAASGDIDEWTPPLSPINWYGRAKSEAERACWSRASPSFHVAILRPTLVYGPDGEEWILRFARSIKSGTLADLGADGEGIANLIYVEDLASICAILVLSPVPQFSTLIVNGSERVTFNEYFEEIRRAINGECDELSFQAKLLRKLSSKSRRPARGVFKVLRVLFRPLRGKFKYFDGLFNSVEQLIQRQPEDGSKSDYCRTVFFSAAQAQARGLRADTPLREGIAKALEKQRWRG
jgi:nucleoside-diphosphate-sugar epimerase